MDMMVRFQFLETVCLCFMSELPNGCVCSLNLIASVSKVCSDVCRTSYVPCGTGCTMTGENGRPISHLSREPRYAD